MRFDASGASKVTGNITAGDNIYRVSASTIPIDGRLSNILCDASGVSQLKVDRLTVTNADVRLSGVSTGTINLKVKLDVNLSGDSDLYYYGEPVMGNTWKSGGSTMHRK